MLLRRVTQHVKGQNWFAVFIDFFIVVVGVFIGIQVANWNETQTNKAGLERSLHRLDKEAVLNIEIVGDILKEIEQGKEKKDLARNALSKCESTDQTKEAIEATLFHLTGDILPNFVSVVLDQLNKQDRYQDLLSYSFQEDFSSYTRILKEQHEQITSHYNNIWFHHVNHHPDVDAQFDGPFDTWRIFLAKPFHQICTDSSFRNRFLNNMGFLDAIERRLIVMKKDVEKFRLSIAKELGKQ